MPPTLPIEINEQIAAHPGWYQFFAKETVGTSEKTERENERELPSPPASPPGADWYDKIEAEISTLHVALEKQGINSRNTTDVFGRPFNLPVDDEHKAKVFGMGIIAKGTQQPHLRAFWAATFGFFSCFFCCC